MKSAQTKAQPYWILIVAILAVSTASILIRYALEEADPIVIAFYRMLLSALFTAILFVLSPKQKNLKLRPAEYGSIILAGLLLAIHFAVWISSLKYMKVSSSVVLVTTTPIWVALASPVVLKEKPDTKISIGLGIAILGGLIIALGASCSFSGASLVCGQNAIKLDSKQLWGYFMALMGAWAMAGYMLIGRKIKDRVETMPYTLAVYSVAAFVLFLVVTVQKLPVGGFSGKTWLAMLGLGLVPQIFGHTLLNFALRKFSALTVSMGLLGEPIGSSILAILLLNEIPSAFELAGGIVILIGVVLVVWFQSKANVASPSEKVAAQAAE